MVNLKFDRRIFCRGSTADTAFEFISLHDNKSCPQIHCSRGFMVDTYTINIIWFCLLIPRIGFVYVIHKCH